MDPTLVVLGIRALARVGQAGSAALTQYATDRVTLLPALSTFNFAQDNHIRAFFAADEDLVPAEAKAHWVTFKNSGASPVANDVIRAAYAQVQALEQQKFGTAAVEVTAQWMITQWGKAAPIGPLGRLLVTITDVALEFVAHDPAMFGVGGKAEPLIRAMARSATDLIPDDVDKLGGKNALAHRFAAIFLRAGLQAVADHPAAVFGEERVQVLLKSTLPEIVKAIPDDLSGLKKEAVIDLLLGPVAQAAMSTLAEDPRRFFGHRFSDDKALGALTRTFLLKASDRGLDATFTQEGAIDLWRATLKLASQRPELFLGAAETEAEKFATAVFKDLTDNLAAFRGKFTSETVTTLTAVALESVGSNVTLFIDPARPYQGVAGDALKTILGAVSDAIVAAPGGQSKLLSSQEMLTAIVRIVLQQAAKTPGMLVKSGNDELKRLVAAIAGAMAKDDQLLLSQDDWLEIIAIAAEEAAANPARLFDLKLGAQRMDVAVPLIDGLLRVAALQWRKFGRGGGAVLFGGTLRDAISIALRAAAGNAAAALSNATAVEQLAERLGDVIARNAGKYGSKEWLHLYRVFIAVALEGGDLATLDEKKLEEALKGAIA